MAVITINEYDLPNWQYGGSTALLRFYSDTTFVSSDDDIIIAGSPGNPQSFFQEETITIDDTVATIPTIFINSTRDGRDIKTARYSAWFFSTDGRRLGPYEPFTSFELPDEFDMGSMTTWAGIAVYNNGTSAPPELRFTFDDDTINRLIADINAITNPMTTIGDIIIATNGGSPMRLAIGTPGQFLKVSTSLPTVPAWGSLTSNDVMTALGFTPLNKAGDTMTGALTLSGLPTLAGHAASKAYVDAQAAGISTLNGLSGASFPTQTFAVGAAATGFLTITSAAGAHTFNFTSTLPAIRGGTGIGSYAAGDLLYANTSTTLTTLPKAATGNVLLSGDSPSWGKVGLTTHISGILATANGGSGANLSTGTGYFKISTSGQAAALQSTIPATDGGTGIASYTEGDLLYANSTTTLTKLAAGTSTQVLHGGTTPSWSAVHLVNDTTSTLTVAKGGTGATTLTGYVKGNGTSAFTAQAVPIPVADGGTGATTLTLNGVLYGNGTSAVQITAQGGANTVLVANAGAPSFSSTPTLTSLTLSGLTIKSVPFIGTSGLITQANTDFFWDDGTSPKRLTVKGEIAWGGSSAGRTGFKAPATVSGGGGTVIYTLPAADGSNGQVLTTNGSGTLSWGAGGGGGGGGITSLNGLTDSVQTFSVTGTDASDIAITQPSSSENNLNIPNAAATQRGVMSTGTQTIAGAKTWSGAATFSSTVGLGSTLTFFAGSATVPLALLQDGVVLTSPVAHAVEWDGLNLFLTTQAASRKTVAYTDSNITGTAATFTGNLTGDITSVAMATTYNGIVPLTKGGTGANLTIGSEGDFLRVSSGVVVFSADGSALTALNATNISTGTLSTSRLPVVPETKGGTNQSSYTLGDTIYASATNTISKLAGNTTTTKKFLTQTGDGAASAAPGWNVLVLGDIPSGVELSANKNAASGYAGLTASTKLNLAQLQEVMSITDLTTYSIESGSGSTAIRATFTSLTSGDVVKWDGSNWINSATSASMHDLLDSTTHGDVNDGSPAVGSLIMGSDEASSKWEELPIGSAGMALVSRTGSNGVVAAWDNLDLTTDVTGLLPVANGGTGLSGGTSGGIPYYSGASTLASTAALTSNGVVVGKGAGAAPVATAAGTANQVFRVPGAGGEPAFGSIDLSSAAVVGSSILPAANGGVGNGTTSAGHILLPSLHIPTTTVSGTNTGTDVVRVFRFYNPCRLVVNRVVFQVSATGGLSGVGIYSATGDRLITTGAVDTTTTGVKNTALGASVTIEAGWYYLAWTANNTTATYHSEVSATTYTNVLNATTVHIGTAANASSGGVLPATLGAVSAGSFPVIIVKLQN